MATSSAAGWGAGGASAPAPESDNRVSSKGNVLIRASDLFFATRPSELTWTSHYTLPLAPSSVVTDNSLHFDVPKLSASHFLFPSQMEIQLGLRIVDKEGNTPKDDSVVSVVNNIGASLFRSVRVFIGDVQVSSTELDTHGLRAYVSTLLNRSYSPKFASLQAYAWYQDRANQVNSIFFSIFYLQNVVQKINIFFVSFSTVPEH